MAKVKYLVFSNIGLDNETQKLLDGLISEKIITYVENDKIIVLGRYYTNKSELRKILKECK